jgi:hypothetical protein
MKNVISLKVRILGSNPFLTREYELKKLIRVVFNDIRAVSMTVYWHHLLFQFSNFEVPILATYLDAAS